MRAFSMHELVDETLRALLQQPGRNSCRRKDVYDIAFLLEHHPMTDQDLVVIHRTLVEKCATRGITGTAKALEDPELRWRAEADLGEPGTRAECCADHNLNCSGHRG